MISPESLTAIASLTKSVADKCYTPNGGAEEEKGMRVKCPKAPACRIHGFRRLPGRPPPLAASASLWFLISSLNKKEIRKQRVKEPWEKSNKYNDVDIRIYLSPFLSSTHQEQHKPLISRPRGLWAFPYTNMQCTYRSTLRRRKAHPRPIYMHVCIQNIPTQKTYT